MSEDDELVQLRASLVEEKKRELDAVCDAHDSMLRELFHLHKFVTLIGFDPHAAKQEKSEVWEEFRKPYDLWDQATSGPSSRRTRRAKNERRESFISSAAPSTSQTPASKKHKPPDVERALRKASMPNLPSMSPTSVLLAPKRSLDNPKPYKAKVVRSKTFAHPVTPDRPGSRKRPFLKDRDGDQEEEEPSSDSPAADDVTENIVADQPADLNSPQKRKQPLPPPVTPSGSSPHVLSDSSPSGTPLPKRIRLIVKPPPPPPIATNPAQLPRPAAFGGSLPRLLSSFALLEEGDENEIVEKKSAADQSIRRPGDVTPISGGRVARPKIGITWEEFEESVRAEVEIWKQIREAKSRGWLGCMRGWEIVRGEEDEPEEEEVEEEDAEGGDTEQELVDGEVERLVESRAESGGAEEQMDEVVGQEGARANSTEGQIDLEVSPTGDPNLVPAEPALDQGPVGDKLDNAPPTAVESNEHVAANGDPPLAQLPGHEDAELEPTPQAADPVSYEIIPGALPDLRPHAPGVLPELGAHTPPGIESNIAPPDHIDSVKSLTPMALDYPSSPLVPEAAEPVEPAEPPVDHIPVALDMEVEIPILPATISSPPQLPTPGTQTSNLASRIPTPAPSTPIPTDPLPLPPLPFLPPSHYETLLAAIPAHSQRVRNIPLTVRHRPARLIARYWEQLQGAADRLVAAEERRVRTGARALARGVVAKAWKDAVAVIRARIREQEEAEQAREGRKHLAAILEQSSALLETQQEDLGLGRRHGGRSRSRSSGAPSSRSRSHSVQMQEDMENEDEEGEGSEGSGGTDVEGGEEEGGSEMLLDAESRDASEGEEGDAGDAIHEADGEDDPDVDVGDEKDLAMFRAESASATEDEQDGFGHPLEDTVVLNDIFDAAPPESLDAMSVVESDIHSARGDAMSIIEGDAMSIVEDTGTPQVQEIGHPVTSGLQLGTKISDVASDSFPPPQVDDTATNGHSSKSAQAQAHSVKSNGHHATALGISTPVTPRSPVRTPMNMSPIPSAPPTVRKLTLKVKSPEPAPEVSLVARRRSSRRTSVSKSEAVEEGSDSEVDGLARDAEMPLEELMRRYGYVGVNEVGADQSSTPREADSDDQDEEDQAEDNKPAAALLGLEDVTPAYEGGVRPPFLLRGTLRHYQQAGMEWLISGYVRGNNGILADEMGLGKTIQTIALLAHLACDRGIWGPHLIIVPTSVILNWEMEFKKFLPGFKVLSYYGSIKERKERRVGWNTEHAFNVVVTSYQLVLADQAIFRRKKWHYMILDEAHNIKNFKSQRWATLFSFNSERRLLLTGTPLQNNITELWSLLYFVQPDTANKQQFEDWFLETMRHAVETGNTLDEQTRDTIDKLHTVLRPYILRRLKCDVEQELPSKHEHIVYCRLSKRQRYLYDEFMSRAQTKETLSGGNFLSIVNCLMQLRKVCNHPDLFEVRPILTSFAIPTGRSAVVDYEIKELLVRRRLLKQFDDDSFDFYNHSFDIVANATNSSIVAEQRAVLNPSHLFPTLDLPGEPPPKDLRTIAGNRRWLEYQRLVEMKQRHQQLAYINTRRNTRIPAIGAEKLALVRSLVDPLVPTDVLEQRRPNPDTMFGAARMIKSYTQREESMGDIIDRFAFATPNTVALDIPRLALAPLAPSNISGHITLNPAIQSAFAQPEFDVLHRSSVKLQIAFPDSSLLQYDCGKLQELDALLREKHTGGHRVLIFTQMTRVLDILEIFLNFHGYRYLRLDGSTKIEQRQVVTERFNVDNRIFAFIASSRSGGVGINLTGADTVIFYDSDYNPSMDRQCEDRAHRIGQTREVSIYRFISKHTVEEAMLRKANQKRLLDDIVIQQGEFDWRQVMVDDVRMERALAEVEDKVDADAAKMAAGEEQRMDWIDFGGATGEEGTRSGGLTPHVSEIGPPAPAQDAEEDEDEDDGLRPIERYMLRTVENDWEFFG